MPKRPVKQKVESSKDAGYFDVAEWGDKDQSGAYDPGTTFDLGDEKVDVTQVPDVIGGQGKPKPKGKSEPTGDELVAGMLAGDGITLLSSGHPTEEGRMASAATTSRERWAKWEALHGGFKIGSGVRDALTPDKSIDGFRTKDGYTAIRHYPPRAGAGGAGSYRKGDSLRVRGSTVYGYSIHAPDGTEIGGTTTLRHNTTQRIIDRHRQEHAPTAAAGTAIERVEQHYGKPNVMPLGGGAVIAHAKGTKTGGQDRFWHIDASGVPSPVPAVHVGKHVPHLKPRTAPSDAGMRAQTVRNRETLTAELAHERAILKSHEAAGLSQRQTAAVRRRIADLEDELRGGTRGQRQRAAERRSAKRRAGK